MDEFASARDEQNCPICSWIWSEDDMTALKYAELSEKEKDAYDEQLINLVKNSPNFDEFEYNCQPQNGNFWSGFRIEKYLQFEHEQRIIDNVLNRRKANEPFKPFPEIDMVKAREVAKDAELDHKAIDRGYYSSKPAQTKNVPKCPICQSTNLSKISTVKKATKVGLFGIFGAGDIGKTYKCNSCGSKF